MKLVVLKYTTVDNILLPVAFTLKIDEEGNNILSI